MQTPFQFCSTADRIKRWVVVNEWYDKKAQIRQDWEMIRICGQDGVEAVCSLMEGGMVSTCLVRRSFRCLCNRCHPGCNLLLIYA